MDKILRGVVNYAKHHRQGLVKEIQRFRENPKPTAIMLTCVDSRLFPMKFTSASVGDMIVVRNAGNLVPRAPAAPYLTYETITNEPGALELACVHNGVKDIVVCGHSDCKAMNLLFDKKGCLHELNEESPLEMWVKKHGAASVLKYNELRATGPSAKGPLKFYAESLEHMFEAYIDPDGKFSEADKLSQINCLQQIQNVATFPFLLGMLQRKDVRVHAFWFDVLAGDVYLFSRAQKRFVNVEDDTVDDLVQELVPTGGS